MAIFETVHIMTTRLNLSDDISVFKEELNRLVETKIHDLLSIVKTNTAEDVVGKYKRLIAMARSSLEANQVTLTQKDKQINSLITALEEERSHRNKKTPNRDDETSIVPRSLLRRVVCETIDAKIADVYSKTSVSYDDILFDQDGSAYLTDCYNWIYRPSRLRTKEEEHIGSKLLTTECKRCFVLVRRTFIFYIFKHIMIQCIKLSTLQSSYYTDTFEYDAYEHNLSSDALFAFKHFQIGFDHHTDAEMFLGFNPLRDILYTYKTHPEYFQSYCQIEELSHERQLFNEEKEKFAKEKQEFEQERRNLHEGKLTLAKNQASLEKMSGRINATQLKISSDLQKLEHDQYLLRKERSDFEQITRWAPAIDWSSSIEKDPV